MKLVYKIPVKEEITFKVQNDVSSILLDNHEISWKLDESNKLKFIIIAIDASTFPCDDNGLILTRYNEIELIAYKLASYINNSILMQTWTEIFNPSFVIDYTPEIVANTEEERSNLERSLKRPYFRLSLETEKPDDFSPEQYISSYEHSQALVYFSDALRVSSPFLKYEQFYKVIEYFFDGSGEKLDEQVSTYVSSFDSKYSMDEIKRLRQFRNRCIHPKALLGHANPEDINSLDEVNTKINSLKQLSLILLKNPPTMNG